MWWSSQPICEWIASLYIKQFTLDAHRLSGLPYQFAFVSNLAAHQFVRSPFSNLGDVSLGSLQELHAMIERAAKQKTASAGSVPEDVFWFATEVGSVPAWHSQFKDEHFVCSSRCDFCLMTIDLRDVALSR